MTRTKTWHVTLAGKWGGVRAVEVEAATEASARKRARALAFAHEHVVAVYPK